MKNYHDITLALAGICQSSRLVQQLSHEGNCDVFGAETLINSVSNLDPHSTLDVYGGNIANLKLGFNTLLGSFNASNQGLSAEITRYMLSMMVLERRLVKNREANETLSQRLNQFQHQQRYFEGQPEGIYHALAGIYVDIISPLAPRIQITGSPDVLKNTLVQAKVRTLLLAGIRSTVLWQQVGGNRWQLMFSRSRLSSQAKEFLSVC